MDNQTENPQRMRRWPYDAAVTISLIALILSAAQLFVTVPLFSQLFFSPELIARSKPLPSDGELAGGFVVENIGNAPATNVEIGFITSFSDGFIIFPGLTSDIMDARANEVLFKNRVIKLERLLPGERLTILVTQGKRSKEELETEKSVMSALKVTSVPAITFLRSTEGLGRTTHLSRTDASSEVSPRIR